jgi:drug/metabolite transporter (DMT)-like permease
MDSMRQDFDLALNSPQGANAGSAISATSEKRERPERRLALLSVLAAVVLWSTSYVVTKVGVSDIPPLTYGAIRFSFAVALAGLLAPFIRLEPVPVRDILRLALGGLLGITAYFALQNLGVQRTSASEATLLVASFPAITMLLEVIFRRARVSLIRFAGVGVAFVGVYLIMGQTSPSAGPRRLEGDLMLLTTGLVWALYNFSTQNVIQRYSTFTVIFWQTTIGAAAFLPLTLLEAGTWQTPTPAGLMGALYLGAFCSVAAFMLYGYGLRGLDPGSAVSMVNLVPIFGLILAVVGLKEEVSLIQAIGGLIVVGGVTLSVQRGSGSVQSTTSEPGRAVP